MVALAPNGLLINLLWHIWQVVVATGKPRGPWAASILPRMGQPVPGVFMQVRFFFTEASQTQPHCCDTNADSQASVWSMCLPGGTTDT